MTDRKPLTELYDDPPRVAPSKRQLHVMAFLALVHWRIGTKQKWSPRDKEVAQQLGISERSVRRLRAEALATGRITATRDRDGYTYRLAGQVSGHDRKSGQLAGRSESPESGQLAAGQTGHNHAQSSHHIEEEKRGSRRAPAGHANGFAARPAGATADARRPGSTDPRPGFFEGTPAPSRQRFDFTECEECHGPLKLKPGTGGNICKSCLPAFEAKLDAHRRAVMGQ